MYRIRVLSTEQEAAMCFYAFSSDPRIRVVFPAIPQSQFTVFWWLDFVEKAKIRIIEVSLEGKICGCLWLQPMLPKIVQSHFWIAKGFRQDFSAFCTNALRLAFCHFDISAMIGIIPVINRGAIESSQKLGYKKLDILPDAIYNCKRKAFQQACLLILKRETLFKE